MNLSMPDMPAFVKREVEKLEEVLSPFVKKVSKYAFWSFPLVTFSIVNLFFLLFIVPSEDRVLAALVFYAVLGAFGMALSKEAKIQRKEIQKISSDYIIERMKKSDIVDEQRKGDYITRVQNQPIRAMDHFVKFLEEENRINRQQWYGNN
ncbi:hypothetical protein GMD78_07790 [Ornithinibacillus sp. L9]|uniref:YwnF n=1 Tax=Ornithinibacillus caprae TaxID=2678566 RepID=A0A6N8FKH7_9BACI|nr:YwnF family protein [Ornithinibacillus caprae]MUK88289.1 hypothetical protein [Ornithinibacillus caprae]